MIHFIRLAFEVLGVLTFIGVGFVVCVCACAASVLPKHPSGWTGASDDNFISAQASLENAHVSAPPSTGGRR